MRTSVDSDDGAPGVQSRRPKQHKKSSKVYEFVRDCEDGPNGQRRAQCMVDDMDLPDGIKGRACGKAIMPARECSGDVTSGLIRQHLDQFHPNVLPEPEKKAEKRCTVERPKGLMEAPGGRRWFLDRVVMIFMIQTYQPLALAGKEAFRWLCNELCPDYTPSCTKTLIKHHLDPLYLQFKGNVLDQVQAGGWFHLSIDGWKMGRGRGRASNRSMIGMTVSWIDCHWQRQQTTIAVGEIFGVHNADNIAKIVLSNLEKMGIPLTSVISMATDNASEEVKAVAQIIAKHPHITQIRCYCHTLNLATQDGLQVCFFTVLSCPVPGVTCLKFHCFRRQA